MFNICLFSVAIFNHFELCSQAFPLVSIHPFHDIRAHPDVDEEHIYVEPIIFNPLSYLKSTHIHRQIYERKPPLKQLSKPYNKAANQMRSNCEGVNNGRNQEH